MTDPIRHIRQAVVDALSANITVYDSFAPDNAPEIFGIVTQITAQQNDDTTCGRLWSVLVDLDVYQDFGKRGGNLTIDTLADIVLTEINSTLPVPYLFGVVLNSTSTNAVFIANRYMYRRNFNFTFTIPVY